MVGEIILGHVTNAINIFLEVIVIVNIMGKGLCITYLNFKIVISNIGSNSLQRFIVIRLLSPF